MLLKLWVVGKLSRCLRVTPVVLLRVMELLVHELLMLVVRVLVVLLVAWML